jgi:hypothetical protein
MCWKSASSHVDPHANFHFHRTSREPTLVTRVHADIMHTPAEVVREWVKTGLAGIRG